MVVDRGMADAANLQRIKARGHHYLVAARPPERDRWLAEFEAAEGFAEVIRRPSPRNPAQVKSQLLVKRAELGEQVYALCLSEDRQDKDRAIRQKQEGRLVRDLERLAARIAKGQLKQRDLINQAIGRLRERYPRVACYYHIDYDLEQAQLVWQEDSARKARAEQLDGAYLLKTDRQDLSADEIWRIYNLLTRVEAAFRALKTPLEGTAHLPPAQASHPDSHLSVRARLSPAGLHREAFSRARRSHLVVDPAPAIKHPSARHRGPSHQQWLGPQDPPGHQPRTPPPRDLCHPGHFC